MTDSPTSAVPKPGPPRKKVETRRDTHDLDIFLKNAKNLVVTNYNASKDGGKKPITAADVYIVWFVKTFNGWKAILGSRVARGLNWEVSFNGWRNEAMIDIYMKIDRVKIIMGDNKT